MSNMLAKADFCVEQGLPESKACCTECLECDCAGAMDLLTAVLAYAVLKPMRKRRYSSTVSPTTATSTAVTNSSDSACVKLYRYNW